MEWSGIIEADERCRDGRGVRPTEALPPFNGVPPRQTPRARAQNARNARRPGSDAGLRNASGLSSLPDQKGASSPEERTLMHPSASPAQERAAIRPHFAPVVPGGRVELPCGDPAPAPVARPPHLWCAPHGCGAHCGRGLPEVSAQKGGATGEGRSRACPARTLTGPGSGKWRGGHYRAVSQLHRHECGCDRLRGRCLRGVGWRCSARGRNKRRVPGRIDRSPMRL